MFVYYHAKKEGSFSDKWRETWNVGDNRSVKRLDTFGVGAEQH